MRSLNIPAPFSIDYGTFADLSPRGKSEPSIASRQACDQVKRGRIGTITSGVQRIQGIGELLNILENDAILVPIPRSSPLIEGGVWPSNIIAEQLITHGLGRRVSTCISRIKSVRKSSRTSNADDRPSVSEHCNSFNVTPDLDSLEKIVLIDDVLTLGRTAIACAILLRQYFPEIEIRLFAFFRTRGLMPEIDELIHPEVGKLAYNPKTGKSWFPK